MPRGEKKAGGRPPKDPGEKRQTLNCRVKPVTMNKLKAWQSVNNESIGEVVDRAVAGLPDGWHPPAGN